ncbi:MAG: hypothetical protein GY716_07425 [bacterium]|nr:hypothetical protein [bacterium]
MQIHRRFRVVVLLALFLSIASSTMPHARAGDCGPTDSDGDGVGDLCDPCPDDAGVTTLVPELRFSAPTAQCCDGGLAVDDDGTTLYVVSRLILVDDHIDVHDTQGNLLGEIGAGDIDLNPQDLEYHADRLYVSQSIGANPGWITEFRLDGTVDRLIGVGELASNRGFDIDDLGNFYVADGFGSGERIAILDAAGSLTDSLDPSVSLDDVAKGVHGRLVVLERASSGGLYVIDGTGSVVWQHDTPTASAMTTDGAGNIYFVDGGQDSLSIFDDEGALLAELPSLQLSGDLDDGQYVALDANGNIYIGTGGRVDSYAALPPDGDADGILDCVDPCPANPDADGDRYSTTAGCPAGQPADCDDSNPYCTEDCTDADGDGFCVGIDCDDTLPDVGLCVDADADGVLDHLDNCPLTPNPAQTDTDLDQVGDACDPCPDDPTWSELGVTGPSPFAEALIEEGLALAVSSAGDVYVGDEFGGLIRVFDSDETVLFEFAPTTGQIRALDVGEDGRVYVLSANDRIDIHAAGGALLDSIFLTGTFGGIAVSGTTIYSSNFSAGEVVALDNDGNLLLTISGLSTPVNLDVGPDGRLYVVDRDQGIQVFELSGGPPVQVIGQDPAVPAGLLEYPTDVSVRGGRVHVAQSGLDIPNKVYSTDGTFLFDIPNPPFFGVADSIAVAAGGPIYVGDFFGVESWDPVPPDADGDLILDCNDPCPDAPDLDGDGLSAPPSCDGLPVDCDDTNPNCGADCTDADGDGYCVGFDCDEANPFCNSDCTDQDSDGFCAPADCDDSVFECNTDCSDGDGDGVCADADCDDSNPNCGAACTDADGDGYCVGFDCDAANPFCNSDCTDQDSDGFCAPADCDDSEFECNTDCTDGDGDGLCAGADCDDTNPNCDEDCTDADGDGYCVGFDCDEANPFCNSDCTDQDGDGFCAPADCDDSAFECNTDCSDGDGDGLCASADCDDSNPFCVADCTDQDSDGYCVTADCDDGNSTCTSDCTDQDNDGFCAPADCDDADPECMTDCGDGDGDGLCADADCDDANPFCVADCTDQDDDGYCVTADCDDDNDTCTSDCTDGDGDGVCATADCNDADPGCSEDCEDLDNDGFRVCDADCDDEDSTVYPGGQELCSDARDNDCNGATDGDDAHCSGLIVAGLRVTDTSATLSWDPALEADSYAVYRGTIAPGGFGYDHRCQATEVALGSAIDTDTPAPRETYYYVVTGQRIDAAPTPIQVLGPLGKDGGGSSRPESTTITCGARVYVDPDLVAATHDGMSWATAYTGINSALGDARYRPRGVEVWVRGGTVNGIGGMNASSRDGARILGSFEGTESESWERSPAAAETVWDVEGAGVALRLIGASASLERITLENATSAIYADPSGALLELSGVSVRETTGYGLVVHAETPLSRLLVRDSVFDATSGLGGLRAVAGAGALEGTIRQNLFDGGTDAGVRLEADPGGGVDADLRLDVVANTVTGGSAGIVLGAHVDGVSGDALQRAFLGSNVVHSTTADAVVVEASSTSPLGQADSVSAPLIVGNTLSDGGAAGIACSAWRSGGTATNVVRCGAEIWDNLISFHAGPGISESADDVADGVEADPRVVGNDLFGNTTLYLDEGAIGLSQIEDVNQLAGAYDNYAEDPRYVDRPSGNYRLVEGTVFGVGSSARYLANASDPGLGMGWTAPAFDDAAWSVGLHGFGYDTAPPPNAEDLIRTEVPAGTISLFTRSEFEVADVASVTSVTLRADYDDGYAVWIDGIEIFRSASMPPGALDWNSIAAEHESSNAQFPIYEETDVTTAALPLLSTGTHSLSIAVWNTSGASDDLLLVPQLVLNEEIAATDAGHVEAPRLAPQDKDGNARVVDGDKDGVSRPDTGAHER